MVQPSARVRNSGAQCIKYCPRSGRVSGLSGVVLEELAEQLAHLELGGHECLNARRCRAIDPSRGASGALLYRGEVSLLLKSVQDRINGAGADLVTAPAKLLDHRQ